MSSAILVVERDAGYAEQIALALQADGFLVEIAGSSDAALRLAAERAPRLVLASATLPSVKDVLAKFSRRSGGPGAIVMVPVTLMGEVSAQDFLADELLSKPFADQDLRDLVKSCLATGKESGVYPLLPHPFEDTQQLTSADIFGDVLAEVEAEAPASKRSERAEPSAEIARRLEETLSGVLDLNSLSGARKRPPRPPEPPPRPPAPLRRDLDYTLDEIDDLLDKTLSGLDLSPRSRPARSSGPAREAVSDAPRDAAAREAAARDAAIRDAAAPEIAISELALPEVVPELALPEVVPELALLEVVPELATDEAATPAAVELAASVPAELPSLGWEAPPALPEPLVGSWLEPPDLGPVPAFSTPPLATPPWEFPSPTPPSAPPPANLSSAASAVLRALESPMEAPEEPAPVAASRLPPEPAPESSWDLHHGLYAEPHATLDHEPFLGAPVSAFEAERFRTQKLATIPELGFNEGIPFGDYTLLQRIAVGGMAEVWQARRRGVEGFQKTVAIKKILSHLTDSTDFVTMFIDEAKLAAQLNHNNIAQIYDLGKVGPDYYIAMEYVDGKDLRSILKAGREVGMPLPMGLALMIAARLARALDYAHRKRDFENRALGLVHRDVSPQNVLISYEGEIKLCDFGIAKAVVKASTTQMGALKGKLQYMSPEQAWGRPVDSRSDIFSLGAVLFEMLTESKLFAAETEVGVLDAVRDCRIQLPSELVPQIPPEVDRIVSKALTKRPEERYPTASELEQEIESVLRELHPRPSETALTAHLEQLFHPQRAAGRPQWEDLAVPRESDSVSADRVSADSVSADSVSADSVSAFFVAEDPHTADARQLEPSSDSRASFTPLPEPALEPAVPPSAVSPSPAATASAPKLVLAAVILLLVAFAVWWLVLRQPTPSAPPQRANPEAPAVDAPAGLPATTPATPEESPPATAGATPAAAPNLTPAELQQAIDQALAKRAAEIRQGLAPEFEAERRRLEAELAAARKAAAEKAGSPPPGGQQNRRQ